jgi:competence protein ComEA
VSDDDETLVRQRLRDLLGSRADVDPEQVTLRPAVRPLDPAEQPPEVAQPSEVAQPAPPSRWLTDVRAFDPGRRGVKALAVVAAVVVLGAAGWAWWARPRTEPVARTPAAEQAGEQAAHSAEPSATAEVVVAVAGKVRRPGLVRLPAGARVADAVEAAGGALPGVDTVLLNPARKVNDGELIVVGVTPPPGAQGAGDPTAGGKVNLNTATQAQLETLPGVGPVLAQRILAYRERHGGFRSVADLRRVEGIGDARFEQLKDLVTV